MKLGVNIDHIATLREARKINEPDILEAIFILKNAGANQITAHLREDRRHMNDWDIKRIIDSSHIPINIESSINKEIINYLISLKPHTITLVPENRLEVTTEGGLLVNDRLKPVINKIKDNGIRVSLFIDANKDDIKRSKDLGADAIEIHTGAFANLFLVLNTNLNKTPNKLDIDNPKEKYNIILQNIFSGAKLARDLGLDVYAGHGLNYQNVVEIVKIKEITELNIGHSIIARAVFCGLECAIKEMLIRLKR
ncbi:pyridoxine 5'-phosphate synthase [Helicobacter sp. MIT 14-3879]|uniref:pyridoxine 5'-phosphate synthase n=1 Tax=Helicobacter sp. MIT 14-3879 TaxID=2040649 RepID=UPI000E1FA9A3|nr:pyridoxine 5'-phosphate synthase [Helicobacter sp. MIT 14-3879]RDU64690.1 pyridoxine 5'-phosphate synthase [Helicobacter sp. MIT 14-3879]